MIHPWVQKNKKSLKTTACSSVLQKCVLSDRFRSRNWMNPSVIVSDGKQRFVSVKHMPQQSSCNALEYVTYCDRHVWCTSRNVTPESWSAPKVDAGNKACYKVHPFKKKMLFGSAPGSVRLLFLSHFLIGALCPPTKTTTPYLPVLR